MVQHTIEYVKPTLNPDILTKEQKKFRSEEFKQTRKGRLQLYKEKLEEGKAKKEVKKEFERPERISKLLNKKVVSRGVFRKATRPILMIRSFEPEPYRSIYFKNEYEKEKRNLFWK